MTTAGKTAQFRGRAVDVVIDVRSHVEYWLGHLPGALCIPVGDLPNALAKHADITLASRILVYCASGGRSASAAEVLTSAGYQNVVDGGGMASAREDFMPASS